MVTGLFPLQGLRGPSRDSDQDTVYTEAHRQLSHSISGGFITTDALGDFVTAAFGLVSTSTFVRAAAGRSDLAVHAVQSFN